MKKTDVTSSALQIGSLKGFVNDRGSSSFLLQFL